MKLDIARSFAKNSTRMIQMKPRLYLLLALTLLFAISAAHAQSQPCVVASLGFPATGPTVVKVPVPSGTCIETPGAQGRLRWDNNHNGMLELYDTDDNGALLWCAHLHDGNRTCAVGQSFCLQSDGNAVIYPFPNCTGAILWESNTVGANVGGEEMLVGDGAQGFCGITGEKAMILNHVNTGFVCPPVWTSTSFDPS